MHKRYFLLPVMVFLISLFVFSANIGGLSIYSLDEAKNAECAREMLERGDFVVPTFNYQLRTDKPPVHYYFMMLSYKLFGVSEFSARFFSAVFGALTVLITFLFGRRYFGERTAFLAFVVLISSLHLSIQFHMAVPDPYLIFFINAALFSFYVGFKERKTSFIYLFYVFMGLGVLTKGPVAVVLPLAVVLSYMFFTKSLTFENVKALKPITGFLMFFAVSVPWYVAVYLRTDGRWVYEFIFKHNIHRFSEPMEGHGGIFLLTFAFIFVGMLPFSVYILQTVKHAWNIRKNDTVLFLMLFAGIYTLFFSISKTKLPNYTVPVYMPLSLLIALYLGSMRFSRSAVVSSLLYIIIALSVVAGLYFGIKSEPPISDLYYLSFWFFILVVGGMVGLYFLLKKNYTLHILSLSVFSVFMGFVFFYIAFPKVDKRNPVMQMLPLIEKDSPVRYYRNFNPAFVFYLRKHIKPVDRKDLESFLTSEDRVYILTRKRYLKDFQNINNVYILKVVKDLFERKTSALVSNRPY